MTNEEHYNFFVEKIGALNVKDSLYAIWGLSNNLQFDKPIPKNIQVRKEFDEKMDITTRRYWGVNEWELEFLCKEIICSGLIGYTSQYTLRDIRCLGEFTNDIRKLEDKIYSQTTLDHDDKRIFKQVFRIYHRQFPWQHPLHLSHVYRYYKIFSNPELDKLVQKYTGLTTFEIIQVGFTLVSMFLKGVHTPLPIKSNITAIPDEKIEIFIKTFGIEIEFLREKLLKVKSFDENLFYNYNPLREFPIIKIGNELFCPFPTMFLWQFTGGLYYRLYNDPTFGTPFGQAFQDYVGFIMNKVTKGVHFNLIPEAKYKVGKDLKDSIDWIVEDNDSYLFIECKTKRMILSAKNELLNDTDLNTELDKMAGFIVQSYKTITHCIEGLYTNLKYDAGRKSFLMILTLEEWLINFHPFYFENLRPLVLKKLEENKINEKIIDEIPYFIDSIKGFERNFQLVNHLGIKDYYTKLKANTIITDSEKFKYSELLIDDFNADILDKTANPK